MSESKFPTDGTDKAIDAGAMIVSVVPWIGGPVGAVLSGIGQQRKLNRVQEVLDKLAVEIKDLESDVAKKYVKTEDFEELLEQTLRRAADERQEEVRELYVHFLRRAITRPGDKYDDQLAVLRAVEGMNSQHLAVLRATLQQPGPEAHRKYMGSPIQTLRERTGFDDATLGVVAAELDNKGLTRFQALRTMMTGHGSEALTHNVTTLGKRVLEYVGGQ
jgi:hypothetical protein